MRVRAVIAAVLVLALSPGVVAGCTTADPAAPRRLVIAAGGPGDIYRDLGEALGRAAQRAWGAQVLLAGSEGSVRNLELVATGEADVGFASVDTAEIAVSGNLPFRRALPIQALARIYDDYLQVVTLAGSEIEIEALPDLAGRAVSIGSDQAGTDIVAERVLAAAGVQPDRQENLPADTSAQALLAGEIDAFFVAGGLPTPAVAEVAAGPGPPPRLLSLQELVPDLQRQHGEYYQARSIPAGTYPGIDTTVETVGIPNVLVVRQDLPADTAYRLTELLFDAKPELVAAHAEARRLDHRSALGTFPIELHPGAESYYRAAKPLAYPGVSPGQPVAVLDDGLHQVGAGQRLPQPGHRHLYRVVVDRGPVRDRRPDVR
jgi:hypothetical protein